MESDKITYKYSKGTCFFYSCFLLWIVYMLSTSLSNSSPNNNGGIIFFCGFSSIPIVFLIFITIRYTIPAIRGKVAFEINQQGVIDYARNFIIEWADISDFRMGENKGDATLYFYFKLSNGIEDFKITRLRWVKGDYLEIYGIIEANLEERGPLKS
ncbi:hypothetical protein [Mucilaginibacter sp.]|jgi:hypothetical protein|uniref:hypothetical protein n=1 Tax=Mucilaginibacter sp. TaxID=1882438 RepID=UPI00261092C7|nr:hypothetical protein [Mucilaginibacter sp.]MDB5126892.1 hypothetical protein [Mucilaginibacter sp.]